MKAIELFKNMGYKLIRNDDDWTIYSKELDDGTLKTVSFGDQNQSFIVEFENILSRQVPSINMELFKAIQQQLLELGWI